MIEIRQQRERIIYLLPIKPFALIFLYGTISILSGFQCRAQTSEFVTPDVDMDKDYSNILHHYKLVFLYTYANWCKFTPIVTPVFDQFARQLHDDLQMGKYVDTGLQDWRSEDIYVGRVNYDKNKQKCNELMISKFPTFKLYRFGEMAREEYRGQRSVESFLDYMKSEMRSPIRTMKSADSLFDSLKHDRVVVGYFQARQGPDFSEFEKAAYVLRDNCDFVISEQPINENFLSDSVFLGYAKSKTLSHYDGTFDGFLEKIREFATPLLHRMTLENVEGFLEMRRPLLVLFEAPQGSPKSRDNFERVISQPQLKDFKDKFTFLYTNGSVFQSVLMNLGKPINDLPVVVLDSLRHMYVFPGDLSKWEDMKAFYDRYFSNDLHREFHENQLKRLNEQLTREIPFEFQLFPNIHFKFIDFNDGGPQQNDKKKLQLPKHSNQGIPHLTVDEGTPTYPNEPSSMPIDAPESGLRRLGPSKHRYTRIKDEL